MSFTVIGETPSNGTRDNVSGFSYRYLRTAKECVKSWAPLAEKFTPCPCTFIHSLQCTYESLSSTQCLQRRGSSCVFHIHDAASFFIIQRTSRLLHGFAWDEHIGNNVKQINHTSMYEKNMFHCHISLCQRIVSDFHTLLRNEKHLGTLWLRHVLSSSFVLRRLHAFMQNKTERGGRGTQRSVHG